MKIVIYLSFVILFLFSFSSCNSTKTNSNGKEITGIWYPRKPNSTYRVKINGQLFISETMPYSQEIEVTENTPEKMVDKIGKWEVRDTIKIIEKKILKNEENQNIISLIVSRQKNGETQYNFLLFTQTEVKGIMTIFSDIRGGFETIEQSKNALKKAKFQNINQELFFSEEYSKTVFPTLKSMEKITKEDYITVVKYVQSYERELMAFAATQEDDFIEGTPYRIDKIAKKIAQKKLYFLGYNPFDSPEDSNYLKKFEGDKEIEELNNTKSEFRF